MKTLNKNKQANPLPDKINLTFAFDVSTKTTGYAILMNDKPFLLNTGKYSIGQIDMIKKEEYEGQVSFTDKTPTKKHRPIKYTNYGDKLIHGAFESTQKIAAMIYSVIAPINNIIGNLKQKNIDAKRSKQALRHKVPEIDKFNIVFEISEIPNYGKWNKNYQSLSSVRKLALFTGFVASAVSSVLHNAAFHFKDKAEVKFIKPTEWQIRCFDKQNGRDKTKAKSIELANKKLKTWGLRTIEDKDDMADAINIASVAEEVRDNVFASAQATKKKKDVNITYNRDLSKTQLKINEYYNLGLVKKQDILTEITRANQITEEQAKTLSPAQKAKRTKYLKMDINKYNEMRPHQFLTPAQKTKLNAWHNKKKELEGELVRLRNGKVING